jgi:hypothetical protein
MSPGVRDGVRLFTLDQINVFRRLKLFLAEGRLELTKLHLKRLRVIDVHKSVAQQPAAGIRHVELHAVLVMLEELALRFEACAAKEEGRRRRGRARVAPIIELHAAAENHRQISIPAPDEGMAAIPAGHARRGGGGETLFQLPHSLAGLGCVPRHGLELSPDQFQVGEGRRGLG